MMYQERIYRHHVCSPSLSSFRVAVKETDLHIQAGRILEKETTASIITHRNEIETCIERYPDILTSLSPIRIKAPLPRIIREMFSAGEKANVGPMAAVAGAVAEHVCRDLLSFSDQVIVENGGDIFLKVDHPVTIGIFAGASPLSMKIGLKINHPGEPFSICTSSGTIGHSLSFGKSDAVCIVASSGALADAAATSVGNRVSSEKDIRHALSFGQTIEGVKGICIIKNCATGFWGDLEVARL
ncbi:MAG: UPF0280 family protein [Proteobacteria bacterium]|nr:UPF0280 family protein [Pseudomonadota bacterium]